MIVRLMAALFLSLTLVHGDCYNAEWGQTGLGMDEDTCYVLLKNHNVSAGYVDKEVEDQLRGEEVIDCFKIEEMFKRKKAPFACNCTGQICNGYALTMARNFVGLTVHKSPDGRIWKR